MYFCLWDASRRERYSGLLTKDAWAKLTGRVLLTTWKPINLLCACGHASGDIFGMVHVCHPGPQRSYPTPLKNCAAEKMLQEGITISPARRIRMRVSVNRRDGCNGGQGYFHRLINAPPDLMGA